MEYQKITQEFQKIHNEIIQRQLQFRMIKKDIYLQKKDKKNSQSKINNNGVIMEYQKLINLLDNIPNHPNKCKTKNWVEINDKSRRTQNNNNQIKFKN